MTEEYNKFAYEEKLQFDQEGKPCLVQQKKHQLTEELFEPNLMAIVKYDIEE